MGACKSKIDGGSSGLAINQAAIEHMKTKIQRRLQKSTNISSKNVLSKQNVIIREKSTVSEPYYNKKMTVKIGPFGLGGTYEDCYVFGCAYDVTQTSNVDIYSYNSNVVNEAEDIFNDIKTKLRQEATAQMSSTAASAANRAVDAVRDTSIENIRSKLVNLSTSNYENDQNVTIEYETPPRCIDPCNLTEQGTRGPTVNQNAMVQIHSSDILNSTLKVIEKSIADHDVDVTQEISSDDDACIMQLMISGCLCFISLLIVWKLIKMMTNKKGIPKR